MRLDSIDRALADLAAGRAVVVVDDEHRENEGDLVFAASKATPALLAFTIRWSSGVVCVPLEGELLDHLGIPLMTAQNRDRMRTAYTVSVDAADGVTTGISAADRARTIRTLVDPGTKGADLTQPGHVFPLRYREGGVLVRPGHTEASVDLARLAGCGPAGVIAEVVNDDGTMKRGTALREFADEHGLALVSIADLISYRQRTEDLVARVAQTRLPTAYGDFEAYGYVDTVTGVEHVALVRGDVCGDDVLVRLHSECLTGDAFGSLRCDCGPQLQAALRDIDAEGRGVVVYLRGHEGRGIGLAPKLRAYALQDTGHDTVDANLALGLPADARDYTVGAQVLADLGVRRVRLITNNPEKTRALARFGIEVSAQVASYVAPNARNVEYLRTKRDRLGHTLDVVLNAQDEGVTS